jgi:ribose/xylose/arabinose/galactoside ABC-type transport system permease subunit
VIGMFLGLLVAVAATILAAEVSGWIPRGGRALIGLAAEKFLAQHPHGGDAAVATTREWEKEVLGDFGALQDRPITSFLFALRVLTGAPRSAGEYFELEEEAEMRRLATAGRTAFQLIDGAVYVIAAVALVPCFVVGFLIALVFLPAFIVLVGIMMSCDGNERVARRSAGLEVPRDVEAEGAITAKTDLADLAPDVEGADAQVAPETAGL